MTTITYFCPICKEVVPSAEIERDGDGVPLHAYEGEVVGEDWKQLYHGPVEERRSS